MWPVIDYADIAAGTVSREPAGPAAPARLPGRTGELRARAGPGLGQGHRRLRREQRVLRELPRPGGRLLRHRRLQARDLPDLLVLGPDAGPAERPDGPRPGLPQQPVDQRVRRAFSGSTRTATRSTPTASGVGRRVPTSGGLGTHLDPGTLDLWMTQDYQQAFRHLFDGTVEQYDPWDAAHRTAGPQYPGTTMCSAFRTFQGWTALSDMAHDQGVLHTVPIPEAMGYLLLRPLLSDVADDDMCGVTVSQTFPASDKWHPLLMEALSGIPDVQAGDTVWWHCDMIHSVAPVQDQQGWGNVMYIPAAPWCPRNERYSSQRPRGLPHRRPAPVTSQRRTTSSPGPTGSSPTSSTTPGVAASGLLDRKIRCRHWGALWVREETHSRHRHSPGIGWLPGTRSGLAETAGLRRHGAATSD